jgi:hypothetical protein
MEMGFREYARHRGVTLGAVQKAIRAGRISVNANNKIDSEAADQAWAANTDASRVAVNVMADVPTQREIPLARAVAESAPPPAAAEKGDADGMSGTDRVASEYREHRATRERFQALTQQLEYEQLVGTLINVDEAKRIAYTSFRALRDAVMNVAPRLKDQLAALTDPHAIEQLLEDELAGALGAIDIGKLLKEQDE